jgi:MFS family permease
MLRAGELSHRERTVIIVGLMTGLLLAALDQTIVSTALPTIVGEFGGIDHLSWVVTAYLLGSTASMPLWGKVSDLYGRKRIYQSAIVLFLVASALCGAAQSMGPTDRVPVLAGRRGWRVDVADVHDRW